MKYSAQIVLFSSMLAIAGCGQSADTSDAAPKEADKTEAATPALERASSEPPETAVVEPASMESPPARESTITERVLYTAPLSDTSLPRYDIGIEPYSECGGAISYVPVHLYDESAIVPFEVVSDVSRATVQIQWISFGAIEDAGYATMEETGYGVGDKRWCTASMLEERFQTDPNNVRFLTAAHCFQSSASGWQTPRKPTGELASPWENATLMKVNFWYQEDAGDPPTPAEFDAPIAQLLDDEYGFAKSTPIDYAIFEVNRTAVPNNLIAASPAIALNSQSANTPIAIVQHPNGAPKQVDADKITGMTVNGNGQDLILYNDLDTYGGSSGSAVVDKDGSLIAVHIQGANTGYQCKPGSTSPLESNKALSIRDIADVSGVL